ncbi:unnamed protein product [Arctia plantaginis]|uniref:Uncharacterized protein n=1 Tax=Arctia plantaginis TaxID=874455 RepID=A0A8S0YSP5_ARCPL|nr:unnamed protein product [Arctia plantaginis]
MKQLRRLSCETSADSGRSMRLPIPARDRSNVAGTTTMARGLLPCYGSTTRQQKYGRGRCKRPANIKGGGDYNPRISAEPQSLT